MSLPVLMSTNPPVPEIRRAEFPFTLIYELHDKEIVVEDTLIGEFAGTRYVGERVRGRRWVGNVENDVYGTYRDYGIITILEIDEERKMFLSLSFIGYLMGDPSFVQRALVPWEQTNFAHERSIGEVFNEHGFRLISFEIAPPIENVFR